MLFFCRSLVHSPTKTQVFSSTIIETTGSTGQKSKQLKNLLGSRSSDSLDSKVAVKLGTEATNEVQNEQQNVLGTGHRSASLY